jgi:hypothetical protein
MAAKCIFAAEVQQQKQSALLTMSRTGADRSKLAITEVAAATRSTAENDFISYAVSVIL